MQALLQITDYLRHRMRRGRLSPEQAAGLRGEDLVHRYLRRRGYTVVARNFQPMGGRAEVDIVAWDDDRLVFIEVKAGEQETETLAGRVTAEKRELIIRAAREWVRRADIPWERVRFDVVTVGYDGPRPRFTHLRQAF